MKKTKHISSQDSDHPVNPRRESFQMAKNQRMDGAKAVPSLQWTSMHFSWFYGAYSSNRPKAGFHMSSSVFPTRLNLNRSTQLFKLAEFMKAWL